ncbi:MAG TPA: 23S rRNA (adenine(2030)-N(6))-methyltransferase RlmJ [Spongiibacteraceae bacterium]|jgi:23S rRNA (adenine2030-N6)-methyltransferase|nr:23S rRNA (adenine(2030)-N(6))-methyltransferase RlmJ [Spongiibacteraceae bacterium]
MLSYRHGFHAGNPADVLKHAVLALCLDYLTRKDKPMLLVDTHAGAGSYQLDSSYAQKTGEYRTGIGRLWGRDDLPATLQPYMDAVRGVNAGLALNYYPGSPMIANHYLRPQDRAVCFELHPADADKLQRRLASHRNWQLRREDGLANLKSLLPPRERRGLVLIDPSYEVKRDYYSVIDCLREAHQRFATGTYLLWYPVLKRDQVTQLVRRFSALGAPDSWVAELCLSADSEGLGMTGSGLLMINPPWSLAEQLESLLPWLQGALGSADGSVRLERLVAE